MKKIKARTAHLVEFSLRQTETVRLIIGKLELSQKAIATACQINPSRLSQILLETEAGRHAGLRTMAFKKMRSGLLKLLENYNGDEKHDITDKVEEAFPALEEHGPLPAADIGSALKIAGEMIQILYDKCPRRDIRRRVLEFLRAAD